MYSPKVKILGSFEFLDRTKYNLVGKIGPAEHTSLGILS